MEFNIKERIIKYYINDKEQGITFNEIYFDDEIVYNLAIAFHEESEALQFIDFQQK